MSNRISKAFYAGAALALSLLAIVGALDYQSTARWVDLDRRIARTQQVLEQFVELENTINETTVNVRIYTDSGEEQNVTRLYQAKTEIPKLVEAINSSTVDDSVQQALLQQLEPAITSLV